MTTFDLPPRRRLAGPVRPQTGVRLGGVFAGTIEQDEGGDWWVKPRGWPFFAPTRFGLRMDAVEFLRRHLGKPGTWQGRRIPDKLVIAKLAEEQAKAAERSAVSRPKGEEAGDGT